MKANSLNLSASLEDYLEAIFNIACANNVARSKDISKLLNVAKPSVTGALQLLKKKGLINYKPYGYITLTDSGITEAEKIATKHDVIKSFFVNILGVDNEVAQQAACRTEHALGSEIVSKLLRFTNLLSEMENKNSFVAKEFKKFRKGKISK